MPGNLLLGSMGVESSEQQSLRRARPGTDAQQKSAGYWTVLDQAEVSPDSKPSSKKAGAPIVKFR